ncbi:UvrB/UvrC motif-containing protein, partial [Candidatus Uhrbacteria bacterium]|nr:UvrB/UvrC motif-containing protein [Candidatus Uhrbacteria bacterium]
EALILEANEIRHFMPKYNVKERDDKSFLYLVFTKEEFPRPQLIRGHELKRMGEQRFKAVYGPYLAAASIRAALKIVRKIFPYSTCAPPILSSRAPTKSGRGDLVRLPRRPGKVGTPRNDKRPRPCFYYHLKLCPGVCIGAITERDYAQIIRRLDMFFTGRKTQLLRELKRSMASAAKAHRFEEAAKLRNQIFALRHIQDVAVLTREESVLFGPPRREERVVNVFGRIEGYDISMISGVEAVGSMVVFEDGESKKSQYRRFQIKWVRGINDVAMMKEVLLRRFKHQGWAKPDLLLIDGGWGQVHAAKEALGERHINVPIVGIAKGFKRKQDRPIYDKENTELSRIVEQYKDLLLRVRDEAHRFAVSYHRKRMRRRFRV